jgi:phage terminase large subunit
MTAVAAQRIQFPDWAQFLFDPARYKVAHGGRGSGKSWAFAMALLIEGAKSPQRVLCARETQKSLKDSVHQLLSDQIKTMGLSEFYQVLETEIRGKNGTLFLFSGLAQHTVTTIKSFEGVTRCWVEEAQTVSKKSWDILLPTIRSNNSEIWVTFNPDMDTDETWLRFVAAPPSGATVQEVNWQQNPWFNDVLEQERLRTKASDPDGYETIWEGKPRRVVAGAIYRHEIEAAYTNKRICPVPYDPMLPVHTVWDLGWNDAMTIGFVQRGPRDIRVIDYIEDSNRTLDWYVAKIESKQWRWGTDFIPHDGRTRNFQTGKSTEELLRSMGRNVTVLDISSVEEGIKAARLLWPLCYFDADKTARLLECLKRYRRQVNTTTNEAMGPLHDEYSHGADMFRYLGQSAGLMNNSALCDSLSSFVNRKRRPF